MCGLVGVFGGNNTQAPITMFKRMLFLDTVRGKHSTGIVRVNKQKQVQTIKEAVTAEMFLDMRRTEDFLKLSNNPIALLGHNRAATVGAVTRENAHPFSHNGVHLCHNGTLRNERVLDSYYDHEVDSEMLCDDISRNGLAETMPKVDGAFALTWIDEADDTLNIIRNDERPLWICTVSSTDNKGKPVGMPWVAYASEPWMLDAPVWNQGLTYLEKPQRVPELKWLKFDLDGIQGAKTSKDFVDSMDTETITEAPYSYNNWGSSYSGRYSQKKSKGGSVSSGNVSGAGVHSADANLTTVTFTPSGSHKDTSTPEKPRFYLSGKTVNSTFVRCAVDEATYEKFIANTIATITCKKLCIEHSKALSVIRCTALANVFSYKTKDEVSAEEKKLPVKKT